MYLKPFESATRLTSALSLKKTYLKILTKHGWSRNAWIECLIRRAHIEIPNFVVPSRKSPNPEETLRLTVSIAAPEIPTAAVIKDIDIEMLHHQVIARKETNTCKGIVAKGKGSSGGSNRGLAEVSKSTDSSSRFDSHKPQKYREEVLLGYGPGKVADHLLNVLAGLLANRAFASSLESTMNATTIVEELRVKQWVEVLRATERGSRFRRSPSPIETAVDPITAPAFDPKVQRKLGNHIAHDAFDNCLLLEVGEFEQTFGLKPDDLRPGQRASRLEFERVIAGEVRSYLDRLALRARLVVILEIISVAIEMMEGP